MHYEEERRRLGILGGFALGIAVGAGAALLLAPGSAAPSPRAAVARARAARLRRGRPALQGGAARRVARRRFRL